jgi:site-specific DNA-methyltransferase (adenine-specific)
VTYFEDWDVQLHLGDSLDLLKKIAGGSCDAVVTSPPYLDSRPEYPSPTIGEFGEIFRELRRVVDGPLLLNVGRKWSERVERLWWIDLIGVATINGWPLRDTVIWVKQNAHPFQGEVLTNAHEYIFLFGDGFDEDAVRTEYDDGSLARMKRRFVNHAGVKGDVSVHDPDELEVREPNEKGARGKSYFICSTGKEKGNKHPAPMPLELAEYMVKLSGGHRILDPFAGSGTTLLAARRLARTAVGIELSPEYAAMCAERLSQQTLPINEGGEE